MALRRPGSRSYLSLVGEDALWTLFVVNRRHCPVTKARELLGYRPDTPIGDGLAKFADWARSWVGPQNS